MKQARQKIVDQKTKKYLNSEAYKDYSYKSKNIPLNRIEPSVSTGFTKYKEKMSITVKSNLEERKMSKKDFYQQLKVLGGKFLIKLRGNQPNQYKRLVVKSKIKRILPKNMSELSLKQRKLFYAVKINNLQLIKQSGFQFTHYDLNAYDPDGKSPLYYAAQQSNEDFCSFLVTQGADCNMECANGDTPVHAAFCSDNLMILNLFLQNNADINVTNNLGQTPLHFGSMRRLQELNLANQVATRTQVDLKTDNNIINKAT